ncbi:MAG: KH domain-containing protein [Bacilli bacterium]|nr:KH domain-containing protein [Bacilli bacterium]
MKKSKYTGKTREDAINQATIALQELEKDLYIKELETKSGLFSKKVEIEVATKEDVIDFIKSYLKELVQNMNLTANIEVKKREDTVTFTILSENNAILIGKNGKTLEAITTLIKQIVHKEIGTYFNMTIDIGEYKVQQQRRLESLAKRVAREVGKSKIEAKLDPMNSYERRLIHTVLADHPKVITESEGEEPNRYIVIKPKEEE